MKSTQQKPVNDYRCRLIDGLEAAIAEKGYAATTISDIVRYAQVSKRTFYEFFADKDACFLASYQESAERTLRAIVGAIDDRLAWREQVRASIKVYLSQLQSKPALTQTYFLEIQAAGPQALKLRREVFERFDSMLCDLGRVLRQRNPKLRDLSPRMATAVVGGINALVLAAAEKGRATHLLDLEETATDLLCTVLLG